MLYNVQHYSGADNIRYTQYHFIMVALASIVHYNYLMDIMPNHTSSVWRYLEPLVLGPVIF
jgi:hypothetical protein